MRFPVYCGGVLVGYLADGRDKIFEKIVNLKLATPVKVVMPKITKQ